ncbi:MAG TPA: 2-oxo acid dehydrogenase subunit E2, partial [Candidatus Eremiobacteraceae bacterium]|nr:2-oxo acid dehydrogenase subunit E2 [Candidatus Eremiobacteraceae bacterium]
MQQTLVEVVLPEMGESITEGSVTSWRKKPGDFVAAGEALVDVTTDKVDVEVPSPAAGKVTKVLVEEGKTVRVGAALAEIDTAASPDGKPQPSADAVPTSAASPTQASAAVAPAAAQTPAAQPVQPKQTAPAGSAAEPSSAKAAADTKVSPLARRMAAIRGVDLSRVQPAHPGDPIRRADVVRSLESAQTAFHPTTAAPATTASPSPPSAQRSDEKAAPLRGAAASLADHMEKSLSIPTATSFRTVPVDVLDSRRRDLNTALRSAGRSEKVSFTHILAYAIARATQTVPAMATSFRRSAQGAERVERGVHLGLAVDVKRPDGSRMLVVPVVRNADSLDFAAFHRTYEALVEKARASTLGPADISGATLTLTNPGGIGTSASVPRLMVGQGAIIAAGAIGYPPGLGALPEATLRSLGVAKVMTL